MIHIIANFLRTSCYGLSISVTYIAAVSCMRPVATHQSSQARMRVMLRTSVVRSQLVANVLRQIHFCGQRTAAVVFQVTRRRVLHQEELN